ncbi:tRNA modification GTPase GTPBP3, mitochondrial-like isoform X3 [Artemia franciscana]|uniref:tRNA modification GTPase GTPBP3, mitochondrial-like isoform X3 n=1 Tax=Artemia franciscana TaxID=6661 RepID=UPI0032D9C17A
MSISRGAGTIFGLSTGRGRSAVAVVRISGYNAQTALQKMTNRDDFPPRQMAFVNILHPLKKTLIDKGMIVYFPGPKSFTGEDCCEFHIHGGKAVISSVLESLATIPDFRPAEAGEFTRRAFLNNKLDLTKVEGLADLLNAETESQRKQALRQVGGDLELLYKNWRRQILKNHLSDNRRGERLRDGVHVAIVGEPNVGKSSLMNILCQRQAAIVSPVAGTTRDVLETTIDIGGYPMILCDTAGIRRTTDDVEQEGVNRAKKRAENADLVILVKDASKVDAPESSNIDHFLKGWDEDVLTVWNKIDLVKEKTYDGVSLSCTTKAGLTGFLSELTKKIANLCADPESESPVLTKARHRIELTRCVENLLEYLNFSKNDSDLVISAHKLRTAVKHMGSITGEIYADGILDVIFSDFCIGK